MRKFLLSLNLVLVMSGVYSQSYTTIVNETFSSTLNGWTVITSSSATWNRDTNYYLSSPSSYKGNVPSSSSTGDSVVLISPVFDLSQYAYVFLRFSHICKVSIADKCQISIKENYTGSKWHVIPPSCYLGTANNYSRDEKFSDESYTDWRSDSLWLQPTNGWWKTENFDITSEASYAPVQFKFTITKGSTVGTEFAAGWFIDNFELFASMNQIRPPVVEFIAPLIPDTVNHTGPFTVNAKVATRTNLPIIQPKLELIYTYAGIVSYDTVLMSNQSGDSIWSAQIPQKLFGTKIKYTINAIDSGGNKSFATGEFYLKRLGIGDSNSMAINTIDYPGQLVVGGQLAPVVVTFSNKGLKNLDSCVLNWSVNGVLQTPYKWRGYLIDDHSTQDTIGYYNPRQNAYDTIYVWVGMPNGIVDTITNDDTAHVYTYGCATILSGEYIVGSDTSADFMNISTVISALRGCGSSGNVILKLQTDTLVENVNLLNLRNFLGVNDTLIITSLSGKANDAVIKPLDSCGFTIGKSNNIIIKNITIDVSSATSKISHGIYFVDTCTNIWIDSCVIIAKNVTDTGYDCIHQLTKIGRLTDIYIMNNTLIDGFHGVYLYGPSSSTRNINVNICNNNVKSFLVGISLRQTNFTNINNNYVTRNSNTARWCHGIMFIGPCYGKELCNNRINMSGVGGPPYASWASAGLSFYQSNVQGASATNRLLVANNEIIITASTGSNGQAAKGIYCSSAPTHTDFLHNSVLMLGNTSGTATASPLCLDIVNSTNLANKATIYNNNFINLSGIATATKNYAIQLPANNVGFVRDYNNYYSVGPNCVGTRSAGYASIQAWFSAFYLDSNSVSVLPDSITATSTDLLIEGSQIICPALSQVPYDINLNQRIVTTNMGCYHTNVPDSFDAGIAELSFSRSFADSIYPTVLVSILNMGAQVLDSVEVHWSVNGVMQPVYKWYGSLGRGQQSTKVNIGNFMVRKGVNKVVVYTYSPNGQPIDGNHKNDTISYQEFACIAPLVGTYTVGGSQADFADEKEMMQAVSDCGVSGTVVFEFLSGTYGDLSFSNYPLASSSMDSITITSAAGHPDSVVFKSSDMAALSIGNIAHFIFTKVTFDATTTGNHAVKFMNPMNNIKFYDCNIYANPTAVTSDYAGVYYNGLSGQINDISFIKNRISGGYYNVYLNTPSANRMILDSNELTNAAAYGFYGYNNANFKSFSNNRIVSRSNTTINYTGFYMYRSKIDTMVCNKVHVTTTANAYGFNMYMQININISPAFIANNEIILNGSTCYGFYGSTTGSSGAVFSRIDYFNNSIYVKGNTAYGIYLYEYSGLNSGNAHISTFKYNNIYASSTSGGASYAYYLASTIAIPYYNFDYNNYYSTGTDLAYITTNCTSIADIIATGTGKDSNSININPMYPASPVNLSPSAMLRCPLVSYITYDIENEIRTISNNSMGCYAKFFNNDVGLDTFFMPSPISIIGNQTNVVVRLLNYGIDTLQNATIQWTLNGVLQTPFNATNLALNQYEDTVLTIGSFIPSLTGNINLKAWAECVGDSNTFNDTIYVSTYACDSMLKGNYTIGATNRDFSSINDAISTLLNCGVAGPVILLIDSGTYAPVNISKTFSGANDTNIVSFTSASGNANDVRIVSSSTAITLMNAGYLNFNHLTIDASMPTAINLLSSANNIEFSNCKINALIVQSDTQKLDGGAIQSENITSAINNLRILNNNIDGGSYNISLQAGKNLAYGTDIVIDNNVMTNAFYTSIFISNADIKSVSHNKITSNVNNYSYGFNGISLSYCNAYINSNKIYTLTSVNNFTGIDLNYMNHNALNSGLLCNNEIIATATTADNYGIKVNQMTYVNIINNSIYLNSAGAKCLYVNNSTSNFILKNNNFISAATAYPIYFTSANYAQNSVMDYNNYYSGGNYIAYAGSSVSNMSTWQALTSNDMHSVSILPSFVNINTDLSLTNSNNNGLICPIDSNVTTDINDSARVLYTYMGAYTAAVFAGNDLEILSVVEPVNKPEVICHQNFASVKVAIKNKGGYLFDFDTNNVRLHVNVTGAINFQKDTLLTTGTLNILSTDTIEITNLLPVSQNGTYHITAWLESVIDQDASNDTTSTDFTVDLLTLPYNENFSTVPSTFTFSQLTGSAGWSVQQGQGTNPVINPVNGSGRLTFASELGAIASARLQPINLLGARNPKLEFWYAHDNNNSSKDDKLFVRVSVDGGSTYQNLAEIKRYNSVYTTPTFVYYTYDLSSYSTYACVIIDFYGQSFGGGNQNIDSISITSLQDLAVALDIIPQNDFVACDLDQKSISAIITNVTTQEFQFDRNPSELVVEVSGATTKSYTHPLVTGSISGNAYMTVVLDTNFDFSTNGTYNFKAYIRSADANTQNDTAVESRVINVDVKMLTLDPLGTIKVGDSFYPTVSFTNTGIIPIRNIPLHLQINKNADVTEIVDSLLNPGDTITYTFVNTSVVPVVAEIQPFFLLEVKSELSCDGNSQNNLVNAYCPVTFEKTIDLLITSIEKPNTIVCDTGKTTVYPIVRIKNQGSAAANNIMLYVTVDSAGTVLTNYSEAVANIDANDSLLHTCVNGYLVPNFTDNYKVTFFVSQAEDSDTTNNKLDVMACAILDDVSVEAFATVNWSMEQNIPNPVSTITSISYSLPKEGTVQFSVTSISGQILYNREIPCLAGEHVLEFDTQNLANGIYYYWMEYQGQSIVKKMTIQK